jgi:hypothetical protein
MPIAGDGEIPTTLAQGVRHEFARVFHWPFDTPIIVAVNGALMSSAWFLLPPGLKSDVFSVHSSLAFAIVLAAWMYSDVPATNVLASDAQLAAAALTDPAAMRRFLISKSIVLWTLVTPVCLIVAVIAGSLDGDALATLYSAIWIGIVPFGVLGISAWLGVLFPYHPMPVRYRWAHQRPRRRMLWRWGALVLIPYGLVPVLGTLIMVPSLVLWGMLSPHGLTEKLPDRYLGWGVGMACIIALACAVGGQRISVRMAAKRSSTLAAFLADPRLG